MTQGGAWRPDTYSWYARIMPVFLVLLPVALAASVWFPNTPILPRISAVLGVPAVLAWLLSQLGRDMGYRRQPGLWTRWGGAPTTQLLRHRNPDANPELRLHYHDCLKALQPSLTLPTAEDEERDPQRADHAYEAATRFLITKTRDKTRFPLIFKENTNYGFRRNLWGMKPIGLPVALLGTAACVAPIWLRPEDFPSVELNWWLATGTSAALCLCWIFWFTPSWVRIAAQAYAERLLEACDQIESKAS